MRIAPIGLAFRHLTQQPQPQHSTTLADSPSHDNNLSHQHHNTPLLREVVAEAIAATHVHPEAIDGATVIAFFVGRCALAASPEDLQFLETLREVQRLCETEEMKKRLRLIEEKWLEERSERSKNENEKIEKEKKTVEELTKEDSEMVGLLSSQWFQLRAVDAVAVALWMFGRHGLPQRVSVGAGEGGEGGERGSSRGEECLVRTVAIGGDTDTIACMVGAMLGALYGPSWIPARWYDKMENGERGRDAVVRLAQKLATLDLNANGSPLSDADAKVAAFKASIMQ